MEEEDEKRSRRRQVGASGIGHQEKRRLAYSGKTKGICATAVDEDFVRSQSIFRIMPRLITERIKELRQEIAEITDANRKYLHDPK